MTIYLGLASVGGSHSPLLTLPWWDGGLTMYCKNEKDNTGTITVHCQKYHQFGTDMAIFQLLLLFYSKLIFFGH